MAFWLILRCFLVPQGAKPKRKDPRPRKKWRNRNRNKTIHQKNRKKRRRKSLNLHTLITSFKKESNTSSVNILNWVKDVELVSKTWKRLTLCSLQTLMIWMALDLAMATVIKEIRVDLKTVETINKRLSQRATISIKTKTKTTNEKSDSRSLTKTVEKF